MSILSPVSSTMEQGILFEEDDISVNGLDPKTFIMADSAQKIQPKKKRIFGSAKGKLYMADDFDDPLEDFEEYM